jgi:Xaa-Pro aminopeptidase
MTSPGGPSHLGQGYALYPAVGEPALVVGPFTAVNAGDVWVRDWYLYGDGGLDFAATPTDEPDSALLTMLRESTRRETPTQALAASLRDRGLLRGRIGIEMEGMTPAGLQELHDILPDVEWKDCSNLIRLIRAVKSPEEMARLVRAAEINEQAGMEALELARPGVSALELVGHFRRRVGEFGADVDHFAYGMRGMGMGSAVDYRFAANDILFVDFGCNYRHYFSDTGTTLMLGTPPKVMEERFRAARECLLAGMAQMKPGVRASVVRGAMMETLNGRGVTVANPHGHGFGLDVRDYPIVVADNGLRIRDECVDVPSDLPLEVDMVINLEVPIFVPGAGSVHSEQSFVVTADGARPLVPQDRSDPVRPGA